MNDWVKPADKLPKEGKAVDIRTVGGLERSGVTFEAGRFWKKRIGPNAGHVWNVAEWRYPVKERSDDDRRRENSGITSGTTTESTD